MASTNFKLFDENKTNMMSDTEYNINTQRLNGVQAGIASSQLQNKTLHQTSLVAYSLAQIMMQNGYDANDSAAVSAFVGNLSNSLLQKVLDKATSVEAQNGVNNTKWMTPALTKAAIDILAAKSSNILSNETKTLYGLGIDAVPDDLFQMLGGLRAVIHVFATSGASVSMTKGEKTFTTVADSEGLADLYPSEFGEWTVTAGNISKTINIDSISVFYMVMSDLESLSWSQVATISKSGKANSSFNIGDKKTLTVNGVSYTAVIIGFNHDLTADEASYGRKNAGITWQLENCLTTVYSMNNSATNSGGWASCAMRSSTMTTLLNQLTSDLKNSIVKVKKRTSAGNKSTAITTTEDYLFLLSEIEVFGSASQSVIGEGTQYEYYQAGNSNQKNGRWWERSPTSYSTVNFCYVQGGGSTADNASYYNGVSFGFCI